MLPRILFWHKKKFKDFKLNKSIYIVDSAQTLHFQQVFKVLELANTEANLSWPSSTSATNVNSFSSDPKNGCIQTTNNSTNRVVQSKNNCIHLPYGTVKLADGTKMSSRHGNVILFSELVKLLKEQIMSTYPDTTEHVCQLISRAVIKIGMLSRDRLSDVHFDLKQWTAKGGINGAYLMYAYFLAPTRCLTSCQTFV